MREVGIMSMLEDFGGDRYYVHVRGFRRRGAEQLTNLISRDRRQCVENRPMMRGKGHVGREWHRQRAQCIINAISKLSYLVCKVSSEGSAENTILIVSSCLVSIVAVQKFNNEIREHS